MSPADIHQLIKNHEDLRKSYHVALDKLEKAYEEKMEIQRTLDRYKQQKENNA